MKENISKTCPESEITREGAMKAFEKLREQAKENEISDMTINEINEEILLSRINK